jgi:hypothetical protein
LSIKSEGIPKAVLNGMDVADFCLRIGNVCPNMGHLGFGAECGAHHVRMTIHRHVSAGGQELAGEGASSITITAGGG